MDNRIGVTLLAGIHFVDVIIGIREECESGRIGTIGNRVKGNLPWVQIPPPPPKGLHETRPHLLTKVPRVPSQGRLVGSFQLVHSIRGQMEDAKFDLPVRTPRLHATIARAVAHSESQT